MDVNPCFSFLTPYEPAPTSQDVVTTGVSNFTIRTAQVLDLTTLAEILTDSFHPRTGVIRWAYPMLRLGIYEDLRNRLRANSPHYVCLVAVADGSKVTDSGEVLAGTVEIALRSPPSWQPHGSQYPYISNLAVRKSYRRLGVARQLLLACERTSLEWGFPDLYLHVLENNHQARQLYLKAGYQLHQVEPSYSAWLFGQPKRLFLHKHLDLGGTS
ncbi:GNAT family N-acetyltransferase [Allocoleopsis franciscana]|uniref:Acetyltransferase n=1 Tax=Allocoleopsis franciscana PCC 7113 TaxID=1173027 RepID=K9WIH8_9CYAN|nr:GNAT family N-acetyltransferase [Allocoleopsis franciscana]AFZ19342.1 acetyltransferase [Allocoleopsis franciscana PCC 7113]